LISLRFCSRIKQSKVDRNSNQDKEETKKIAIGSIKSETNKKETNNYDKKELNKKKLKLKDNIDKNNKREFDSNAKYVKKRLILTTTYLI